VEAPVRRSEEMEFSFRGVPPVIPFANFASLNG
jgi:hypothetical protein